MHPLSLVVFQGSNYDKLMVARPMIEEGRNGMIHVKGVEFRAIGAGASKFGKWGSVSLIKTKSGFGWQFGKACNTGRWCLIIRP